LHLKMQFDNNMRTSEIKFIVHLDENNIPEKIKWDATENPEGAVQDTNAISLSLWDNHGKGTMKIDLWTKEMPVGEMKRFYIETIGGLGESLLTATGDEKMNEEIQNLCRRLAKLLEEQESNEK
jgi:gliding motility-associated protein GldC